MEAIQEKKKNIHQGMNTRLARTWKKVTQDDLAYRMGMNQSEVSLLEGEKVIKDETLEKIARALDVPLDFLKEFEPEAFMNTYNQYESKIEITSAENSKDNILQQGEQNITNHYYPLDDIKALYNKLLAEKDKQIEQLEKEITALKEKLR